MVEITEEGLKDYLHSFARVGDVIGFLRKDRKGVHLYLYDYKDGVKTYRFKGGDEIRIWFYGEETMGPKIKTFKYAENLPP